MATAIFRMRNGDVAVFDSPLTSKSELRGRIERAMAGSSPILSLIDGNGVPMPLEKSKIKDVEYR